MWPMVRQDEPVNFYGDEPHEEWPTPEESLEANERLVQILRRRECVDVVYVFPDAGCC